MRKNYILGRGEVLTGEIPYSSGYSEPTTPYSAKESGEVLIQNLKNVQEKTRSLPPAACPRNTAVFSIIMHPQELATSYYPESFIKESGLSIIGSKNIQYAPRKMRSGQKGERLHRTVELFAAIKIDSFDKVYKTIDSQAKQMVRDSKIFDIQRIEAFRMNTPDEKILSDGKNKRMLEMVVHTKIPSFPQKDIINHFIAFCKENKIEPIINDIISLESLSFIPVIATNGSDVARNSLFSFMRAQRLAPKMRTPILNKGRVFSPSPLTIPSNPNPRSKPTIGILDTGFQPSHPLNDYVVVHSVPSLPTNPSFGDMQHGSAVSSALLLGPFDEWQKKPTPIQSAHFWNLADESESLDPYTPLKRALHVLNKHEYRFVNLSYGPAYPIADNEIDAWTAGIDSALAQKNTLMTVAVGNDGNAEEKLNRIQPPSDGVNLLSVGSSGREKYISRAPYSCIGPGRRPGFVKPDLVAFGGVDNDLFQVVMSGNSVHGFTGTSLSAPLVLHKATHVDELLGQKLHPLTIKALLIHRVSKQKRNRDIFAVGWGRVDKAPEELITCEEDEVTLVYQGALTDGKVIRARVPLPSKSYTGKLQITATICIKSDTDASNISFYTRRGIEVVFRPDQEDYNVDKNGALTEIPKSSSFFTSSDYNTEEERIRRAYKWETVLHKSKLFAKPRRFIDPVFDIHLVSRLGGVRDRKAGNLPYSLVVTAKVKGNPNFYNEVVQRYKGQLEILQPVEVQVEQQIRT